MHYFNRQEIKELCNIFSSCVIEDCCVTRENGKYTDYENLVFLTK
ncbi:MAG: hypothetical protein ACI4PK_03585 [Oscillospiraceae bacterium]